MKDFAKSVRTGNETIGPNWDKKRQLEDELRGWMTMVNKLEGEEKRNAEKQISDIRKELNDVKIKIAHGENKKFGNSKVGNSKKTFSGKYIDIYDDGQVIIKDGWAFGERFNENNFRGWIEEQIRLQEKTLQTSKQMRSEFEKNI